MPARRLRIVSPPTEIVGMTGGGAQRSNRTPADKARLFKSGHKRSSVPWGSEPSLERWTASKVFWAVKGFGKLSVASCSSFEKH